MSSHDKIIDYLKNLDLSEIEAKLYLTLLETGPISVRELAATVDIKRTTTYFYIDKLVEKSLIIKIVKGSQKQVAANQPKGSLRSLVDEKLLTAKNAQVEFPDILKEIEVSLPQYKDIGEAEIKYYKGKNGVKKIYEEALKAKELRSFVNLEELVSIFPENYKLFNDAFKNNPTMTMYEIAEDSPEARKRIDTSNERHYYKLLPKNLKLTAQDIIIFDKNVAIIHFKASISGIVLRNADLYNNFKLLFDFIWKVMEKGVI